MLGSVLDKHCTWLAAVRVKARPLYVPWSMADINFLAGPDVGHRCQPHCAFLQTLCVLSEGLKTTSRSDMARDVFNEPAPPTTTKKKKKKKHTHTKSENLLVMVQKYYSDGIALYSLCIKQRRVCPPKSFHYSMFIWDFACGSQCVRIHCCIVSASNQVN